MGIPEIVFANLSPQDHMIAALLDTAKDDDAELQVPEETCPKESFKHRLHRVRDRRIAVNRASGW